MLFSDMKAGCSVMLVILLCRICSGAQRASEVAMNSELEKGAGLFTGVLSRIHPIESVTANKTRDTAVYEFCWEFFRPDLATYGRLRAALERFRGGMHWQLAASTHGRCIVAYSQPMLPVQPFQYAPPAVLSFSKGADVALTEKAVAEIPALCQHLEAALNVSGAQPKIFDPDFAAKEKPETEQPINFYEPGFDEVWLTSDPQALSQYVSAEDRRLNFAITYSEWRAIFVDVLKVKKTKRAYWLADNPASPFPEPPVYTFNDNIQGFPLLSRLRGPQAESKFQLQEVVAFQNECIQLRSKTSNRLALRGLNKLVRICQWALHLRTGIYMFPDEEARVEGLFGADTRTP